MFPFRRFLFQTEYPENWEELRKEVYRRNRWQCQKCGAKNTQLFAHHKTPLSWGGSNDIDNLMTLCKDCHIDNHPHMWLGRWAENNPEIALVIRIILIVFLISLLASLFI